MENFKIDQEEKNRILSLHENYIKEQLTDNPMAQKNVYSGGYLNQTGQLPTNQMQVTQPQQQVTQQQQQVTQPQPQPQQVTQITPGEKIVPGVRNATVIVLQQTLNDKYKANLVPDGKLGPKTMAALGLNEDDVKTFVQECLFPDIV